MSTPVSPSPLSDIPAQPLPRTITLVGLMGAGKTVVGRRLAHRLGIPFVDADSEVEKAAGCSVREIFENLGEAAFREGEAKVIARLLEGPTCILATGGGAFMNPITREIIASHGLSVWLKADLDILVARTTGRSHRPLLNHGDPRATLSALMRERYPVYASADITVELTEEPPESTCGRVLQAIEQHLGYPLRHI